ncbi:MAG: helix-turn-helix transcriptional regulator [Bryobacterales bacterium]|nr:helix-turn-helix transcriptional regulator [Bryobacterales bacterium]
MSDKRSMKINLSARIKEEREYLGLSQQQVASHIGVPRSAISLIESGSRRISAEELSQLAELFRTTTDRLLGRDDVAPDSESVRALARAAAALSAKDREEVLRFAQFLRTRKSNQPA